MTYVDGFVLPVPKRNLAAYLRIARKAGRVWREHGALEYRECSADQLQVRGPGGGKVAPFARMLKLKKGETVVFAWITYRSRAHRDRVNAKVLEDPRIATMMSLDDMPFDMARMAMGGFEVEVDL